MAGLCLEAMQVMLGRLLNVVLSRNRLIYNVLLTSSSALYTRVGTISIHFTTVALRANLAVFVDVCA